MKPGDEVTARAQRKHIRSVVNATKRAYAPGREERIAKAQAKRDRKAEKRTLDAKRAYEGRTLALYRMLSREARRWLFVRKATRGRPRPIAAMSEITPQNSD